MKPLFVITALTMGVLVTLSVTFERFHRHRGRLGSRDELVERMNNYGSVFFSFVAYFSLLLVAVLDCKHYYTAHISLLGVFLGSAGVATYWSVGEYFLLDQGNKRYHRLRISYVLKFIWVTTELVLVIPFTAFSLLELKTPGAVLEWVIAYLYGIYLILLAFDHYNDFSTIRAQILERDTSNRLNQLMVITFRRSKKMSNSVGSFEGRPEEYAPYADDIEMKPAVTMSSNGMNRRVSSIRDSY